MGEVDRVERAARLRLLLALEIDRVTRDLLERAEFLVAVWSRYRRRDAFLDTLFSRWRTLGLADLAELDPDAILALEAFHGELEHLRLYLTWTEDMPTTLRAQLEKRGRRLERAAEAALDALGGVPAEVRVQGLPKLTLESDVPGGS